MSSVIFKDSSDYARTDILIQKLAELAESSQNLESGSEEQEQDENSNTSSQDSRKFST